MSRHVLLVHQLFITSAQAGGTRHAELARHLCDAGNRVTVIAGRRSYLSGAALSDGGEPVPGLAIRRAWSSSGRGSGFVARVLSFATFTLSSFWAGLRTRDVDVVFGTTPPLFQAITAYLLARVKRVPLVLEVRDLWPDFAVALGALSNPTIIAVARRVEAALYRAADVVLVNSPGFVDHVGRRGARTVVVIPNGVDVEQFRPDARGQAFRDEFGLGGRAVALYAGAHGIPNDLDTVLDAAARIRGRDDIVFVMVGDGREKARLVERGISEQLTNVVFIPPQPKSRMPEVLAASDVALAVLAPLELFGTVYPNKVFDYMAAGRPTILLIGGVAKELVERADAGLYSPPGDAEALGDAVVRYVDDPELRARQGRSGRRTVETEFRRADHGRALVELVESVSPAR